TCVDLQNNGFNCGRCNLRSTLAQRCCNGTCKDVVTDSQNCGGCGNTCPTTCKGTTRVNCVNGIGSGHTYSFLVQDQRSKCLSYFVTYTANSLSEATQCAQNQYPPWSYVVGATPLSNFTFGVYCPDYSGGCWPCRQVTVLAPSAADAQSCIQFQNLGCTVASSCQVCSAGFTDCCGACKDLLHDVQNCGGCNQPCSPGTACCGGLCIDLQNDSSNCGSCGRACTGGK